MLKKGHRIANSRWRLAERWLTGLGQEGIRRETKGRCENAEQKKSSDGHGCRKKNTGWLVGKGGGEGCTARSLFGTTKRLMERKRHLENRRERFMEGRWTLPRSWPGQDEDRTEKIEASPSGAQSRGVPAKVFDQKTEGGEGKRQQASRPNK